MAPFADYDSFDSCVSANSDKENPEAYCGEIKRQIEGEDSLSDVELQALEESNCGEGHVEINGECVPIEDVDDAPPSLLGATRTLAHRELAGPIRRVENDDGTVTYENICILSEGVWTDQSSGKPTHYVPKNLEVVEDNTVNVMHDADNEVSAVGQIEPESAKVEESDLYADVTLHMDNAASEYADENLQKTLETEGEKGFGGPSVEIPAEGLDIEPDGELGYPKTESGKINGMGFVGTPAAKTTAFDRQTKERAVALSEQSTKVLERKDDSMSPDKRERIMSEVLSRELQVDEIQDDAQAIADELDVPVGDVMEVLDPLLDMDEEGEDGENGDENGEDVEAEDDEDDETDEEEEEQEMEDAEAMQEQIDDLRAEIEDLKESMMSGEELSEELESTKEELAAAETVQELEEAKEELDRRLSDLEDEPKKTKTLADTDGEDFEPNWDTTPSSPSRW